MYQIIVGLKTSQEEDWGGDQKKDRTEGGKEEGESGREERLYKEEKKGRERKEREASKYYRKKYPIQELHSWYKAATIGGQKL